MEFTFAHNNIDVLDLDRNLDVHNSALNPTENCRWDHPDVTPVYLGDRRSRLQLELALIKDPIKPVDRGNNEIPAAFYGDDCDGDHTLHHQMGCICYENKRMEIYFIADPEGCRAEVMPFRDDHEQSYL